MQNGSPLEIRDLSNPVEVFTRRLSSQKEQTMTELGTTEPSWKKNTIRVNMRYVSLTGLHQKTATMSIFLTCRFTIHIALSGVKGPLLM